MLIDVLLVFQGVIVQEVAEGKEAHVSGFIKDMDILLGIDREDNEKDNQIDSSYDLNCSACSGGHRSTYRMNICREGKLLHILLKPGSSSGYKLSQQDISDCGIGRIALPCQVSRNGCSQLLQTDVPDSMANNMWKDQSLNWLPSHCYAQESCAAFTLQNIKSADIMVDFRSHPEGYTRLVTMERDSDYWKPNSNAISQRPNISSTHTGVVNKVCDLCQNLSEATKILSSLLLDSAAYSDWCACILIRCNQARKTAIATIGKSQRSLYAQHMKIAMNFLQRMFERRKVLNAFKAWRSGCMFASSDQTGLIDNDLEVQIGESSTITPKVWESQFSWSLCPLFLSFDFFIVFLFPSTLDVFVKFTLLFLKIDVAAEISAKLVEKESEAQKYQDERDYCKTRLNYALKILGRSELLHL
jgi:hypothetical protein